MGNKKNIERGKKNYNNLVCDVSSQQKGQPMKYKMRDLLVLLPCQKGFESQGR